MVICIEVRISSRGMATIRREMGLISTGGLNVDVRDSKGVESPRAGKCRTKGPLHNFRKTLPRARQRS
jgi:hypothetical protein